MRKFLVSAAACVASAAFLAPAALGQSFNIDFNSGSGAGAGAPAMSFKGAAGQAGFWNAVGSTTPVTLAELDSAVSAVTLTRTGGGTITNNGTSALNGDFEKLLEDAFSGSAGASINYSLNNLQAGTYAVYTYAIDPASSLTSLVSVTGSTSQTSQPVGSLMSGPNFFVGATHALHVVTVPAGGSIQIGVGPTGVNVDIAGIQVVKLPGSKLRMFVSDAAAGAVTGSSWSDAFTHPTTALRNAWVAGGANCEIWVENGFYKPTGIAGRLESFDIPSGLKMYGGFNGSETSLSERSLLTLTYLDGDIGNTSSDLDNCFNVVVADGTSADTLLDGFRIFNGYNNDGGVNGGDGGGIRMLSGSMTIRGCSFVNNLASDKGGAIFSHNGSPTIVDCTFDNNEAFDGSAVYHSGTGSLKVYNSDFLRNDGFQGTIRFDDSDGLVAGSLFHGNYCGGAGSAVETSGANSGVTIVNCTIAGNTNGQDAAVYVRDGADMFLRNSILWFNEAGFAPTTLQAQYAASGFGSTISASTTIVEGGGGWNGSNPLFVDGDGADNTWGTYDDKCQLQANSPAVNTGSVANVPQDLGDIDLDGNVAEQLPIDLDGNPRINDVVVDVGAYEYEPQATLIGDMNCDGFVTVGDIGAFVLAITDPAAYQAANPTCEIINGDCNQDGFVTVGDIGAFVALLTNL